MNPIKKRLTPLQELTQKYKRFRDNIKWHIDTNKPTGDELKESALRYNDFAELVVDLESIAGAASRESGCRWVKASERTPTEIKEYFVIENVGGDDEWKDCAFWNGKMFWVASVQIEFSLKNTLWLDETESAALPEEGDDAILFAEFLNKNHMAFDGFGGWVGKINTNHYGSSSKQLYSLFKQRK